MDQREYARNTLQNSLFISLTALSLIIVCYFLVDPLLAEYARELQQNHRGHLLYDVLRAFSTVFHPAAISAIAAVFLGMRAIQIWQEDRRDDALDGLVEKTQLSTGEKWYLYKERLLRDTSVIYLLGLFASLIFTLLLKYSLGRARPAMMLDEDIYGFFGFQMERLFHAMPSAHTSVATAAFCVLWMLFPQTWLRGFALTGLIIILLSRLFLGEHFPADIIAGVWLGFTCIYWARLYDKVG
ncbi:MAG: phosphatase PAP2 family protein [Cyclonatronaceae bacterium]